jgi:hypothetical protein
MNKQIGQRVTHQGFGVTGTITGYDKDLNVFVVALDEPMHRMSKPSLTELRAPDAALEAI